MDRKRRRRRGAGGEVDVKVKEEDVKLMQMKTVSKGGDKGSDLSCPYPSEGTFPSSLCICPFSFLQPPLGQGLCLTDLVCPSKYPSTLHVVGVNSAC